MKRIFSFLLLIICHAANAQNAEKFSYYYQGKKISFAVNDERLVIQLLPGERPEGRRSQIAAMLQVADTALKQMANKKMFSVKLPAGLSNTRVTGRLASLRKQAFVGFVHPVLISASGKDVGYGDELVVKLKASTGIIQLEDFVKKNNCSIVKKYAFSNSIYIVSAGAANNYDAAETANRFFESGLFEYAEPDFTVFDALMAAPNDPLYNYQWGHQNTGSAIQYNGTPGVDMQVQQAWNITKGAGIKVAVIDEGVDLTHPDLQANLLQGFDAISGTANPGDGKPLSPDNGHGTSCTGIIAAVANNNIGIAGVAPDCKIIPINIAAANGDFTAYSGIAAGFDYAWQNGADVISNSWGGGIPSNMLDDAISRAVTLGRGGKGCIVLFAAGNNPSGIGYPSSNSNTICVGAANMCGQRKERNNCDAEFNWASSYGLGLDVLAPGVKIATTDISGAGGYNAAAGTDGNYFLTFNGTSSATPAAAAVAALILAVNNNLTTDQVRNVLEGSCTKLPGYSYSGEPDQPNGTWNTETGYGMVNAFNAVQTAGSGIYCNVRIMANGPTRFCPGGNVTLSVINPVAGASYQWRKDGLNFSTGASVNVHASGSYDLSATTTNGCIVSAAPITVTELVNTAPLVVNAGPEAFICLGQSVKLGGNPVVTGGAPWLSEKRVYGMDWNTNNFVRFSLTDPLHFDTIAKQVVSDADYSGAKFFTGGDFTPYGYYAITQLTNKLIRFDTATGAQQVIGVAALPIDNPGDSPFNYNWADIAWDPDTKNLYGVAGNGDSGRLYIIDPFTAAISYVTTIKAPPDPGATTTSFLAYGMAINNEGNMYVGNWNNATLYKVDKYTGTTIRLNQDIGTLVWAQNQPLKSFSSESDLDFDPFTNKLYLTALTAYQSIASDFRTVDTITGKATLIGSLGGRAAVDAAGIAGPGYQYNWSPAAGLSNTTVSVPVARPLTTTTYMLNVTDMCGNTASSQVTVNVNAGQPPVKITAPSDSICVVGTVRLSATQDNSYKYQWYKSAVAIPGATDSFYVTSTSGVFTVKVQSGICDSVSRPFTVRDAANSCYLSKIYRSRMNGNFINPDTWQVKSGNDFVNAVDIPHFYDDSIIIRTGDTVIADQLLTMDQVCVQPGAVLKLSGPGVIILNDGAGDDLVVDGKLEVNGDNSYIGGKGNIKLNGNLDNFSISRNLEVKVDVAGNSPQIINTKVGVDTMIVTNPAVTINLLNDIKISRLEINNAGGAVNVNGPYGITVISQAKLLNGKLVTGNNAFINIAATGLITVGNNASFVDGALRRNTAGAGASNLFFPVGKDVYRAVILSLTAPLPASTSTYQVQVFNTAPANRALPSSLGSVSGVRYYKISKMDAQAPAAASILLSYDADDAVQDKFSLRIAKDDGAGHWIDLGGTGATSGSGVITSTVNFTSFGDFVLASTQPVIPGCATNIAPANGTIIGSSSATALSWNAVSNASSYDVYIWTGVTVPTTPTANVAIPSYTVTGLTAGTSYNWYIAPRSASGANTTCATSSRTTFTTAPGTATLPPCITNTLPANGAVLPSQTSARLTWPASSGATSYDIYLAAGNAVPTVLRTNTTALTYYATGLTAGTLYSWYIAPGNANGANTACGATNRATFITAATTGGGNRPPVANGGTDITITLPVSTTTLNGTASYDPDGSVSEYYWYQSQGPVTTTIANFSATPVVTGLTTAGNYTYGLQVKDNNGITAYSQVTVTVNPAGTVTAPACVANTLPAADATLATQNTATLVWPSSATATSYDVYLAAGNGTPAILVTNTTALTYSASGLTAGTLYSWYIAPRNASGANTGCATASRTTFTTAASAVMLPACVTNTSPASGSVLPSQTSASLVWPASAGAVSYDVYLATGNATPTLLATNTTALTYYATGLIPGTLYSWYIAPRNASGANTACGATNKTTFTTAAATGGGNIAPVSNAGSSVPITLPVSSVTLDGSASYDPDGRITGYYWFQASGPAQSVITNAFSVSTAVTGLTVAGTYIFVLQVSDNSGVNSYANKTVIVNPAGAGTAPACVTNTSPATGTTLATQNTATLVWPSSATATSYDVYLSAGTGTPATMVTNTTALTYSASGLTAGTTYSWYIAPRNASGANSTCATSNKTTFITAAAVTLPACVTNTSPVNGSVLPSQTSARLVWPASAGAVSYDVYLSAGTGVPATLATNTTALTYYAINLSPGTAYSWYIAPRNANGANTACGATNKTTFTTAGATGGGNIAPKANAGTNTSITLPVSAVILDGSASYDPDGRIAEFYWYVIQTPVTTSISSAFSMTPTVTGLTTAGNYLYGLQVKDNNGVPSYSQVTVTVKITGTTIAATTAPQTTTETPLITASISPNPVARGGLARLQINSYKKCSAVIDIVNSSGSILSTQKVNLVHGVNTTGIITSALAQGLYIIRISGVDKPINLKLLVIN